MNQKPICVSQTPDLKEALVLTGFHYGRGKETRETLRYIEDLMSMGILGIRRTGSAALDLAYLACGRGDAFWEYKLSPWDIAAGILIVREAGGIATDREGHPLYPSTSFIIAANARIHPILLEILRKPPICASE
jgi:myo-inositol-1(or 4)-monophosphatase